LFETFIVKNRILCIKLEYSIHKDNMMVDWHVGINPFNKISNKILHQIFIFRWFWSRGESKGVSTCYQI